MTMQTLAVSPPQNRYSEKYHDQIPKAAYYELRALFKLRNMGLYDCDYTAGWHITPHGQRFHGPYVTGFGDRFDLYSPFKGLWFEVSSSSKTFEQSKQRYGTARLAILPEKVEHAQIYGIVNRLVFVSVNYNEGSSGEIRFLPCVKVPQYAKGAFSFDEGEYYLTEWRDWLRDHDLAEILSLKEGP